MLIKRLIQNQHFVVHVILFRLMSINFIAGCSENVVSFFSNLLQEFAAIESTMSHMQLQANSLYWEPVLYQCFRKFVACFAFHIIPETSISGIRFQLSSLALPYFLVLFIVGFLCHSTPLNFHCQSKQSEN